MLTSPEHFAEMNKTAVESMQTAMLKSIESFEKLAELNLQLAKTSIGESAEQVKTLIAAKDPKAFSDLWLGASQPAAEKFTAYAKHVYDIANETGTEMSKLVEKHIAEANKQIHGAVDTLAKNAPAGTEGVVSIMKNAVSMGNSAYEQATKATKQAVEMVQSNMAAAVKAAPRTTSRKAA
jgi:phasin family protein